MTDSENVKPAKPGGRFVKGKSGNPSGRPRKTKPKVEAMASAYDIITTLTLPMVQDGVERQMTFDEVLTLKIYQNALKGSPLDRKKIIRMIEKRDAIRTAKQKSGNSEARNIPKLRMSMDTRNADAAMLILGIARHNPKHEDETQSHEHAQLLLEPWAVQAALSRRRSTVPLSRRNISDIIRCTGASNTLKWPSGSRDY
ncbi:MAG: hypothetical protein RIR95_191 [Pseudomonadota bacterium]